MNVLRVVTPKTVQKFGQLDAVLVTGEQEMDLHYQQTGSIASLLPPVNNTVPNASQAAYAVIILVPNGIAHLFAGYPHPYTALLRIRKVKSLVPTVATSIEILEHWYYSYRTAYHKGTGETSVLAQTWEAPMFEDGICQWAQNKHD